MIESKVYAAMIGAGAGTVIYEFLLWVLGVTFWHSSTDAANAVLASAAVPAPVSAVIGLILTVGFAFVGGYLAPHTPRVVPQDSSVVVSVVPSVDAVPSVVVTQSPAEPDPPELPHGI